MNAESERHIESVTAALRLLSCFDADVGLRLLDIHNRTQLNRSRILRLAGTLVASGYLEYNAQTSTYHLGPAIFAAGSLPSRRFSNLAQAVRPNLRALVNATGDTSLFSVVSGEARLVLSKEEPTEALRYTVQEGQLRPIAGGASGRVILAFCEESLRSKVLKNQKHLYTNNKDYVGQEPLLERLSVIRDRGFDWSLGELTSHAFAVAVPVLAQEQTLLGVLSLAGPEAKISKKLRKALCGIVERASRSHVCCNYGDDSSCSEQDQGMSFNGIGE